ncbi:MAG: beta-hydroxyacyl-ACP dehydratase [Fibrobacter sp.]|nr:beta-hydroxyacyl-ACP dehydratase [Fibrobacter sp.]
MLYDADVVHELLPQKFPFAFVDEVVSLEVGKDATEGAEAVNPSIVANFHLTGEEGFLKGHFPGNPVMPGVIQIEAMAQAATVLTLIVKEAEVAGKRPAFMGVEECRFRAPVIPKADLTLKATLILARRGIYKYTGEIYQGDTLMSKASFSAAMV